jgi:hypothetical protein
MPELLPAAAGSFGLESPQPIETKAAHRRIVQRARDIDSTDCLMTTS